MHVGVLRAVAHDASLARSEGERRPGVRKLPDDDGTAEIPATEHGGMRRTDV